MHKDVLPPLQISLIIYSFKCQCSADYIDRTSQMLEVRISQHVPATIEKEQCDELHRIVNMSGSAIAEHLCPTPKGHSKFHFKALETSYIKSLQYVLCKQDWQLLGLNIVTSLWKCFLSLCFLLVFNISMLKMLLHLSIFSV